MSAFDRYLQGVIDHAAHEAHQDGAAAIEAHHLLLGIAAGQEPTTRDLLASAGLDHHALREALRREFEHSLSSVGVSASAFALPEPSRAPDLPAQLGASVRLALDRLASAYRKKDLRPAHLLLGILQAQAGTVPRALDLAGVDRAALTARVLEAVSAGSTGPRGD